MVRPDAVNEAPDEHDIDTSAPHPPEKSWIRGFAGAEDKVIVGFIDCATKLYQTSFLLATPQPMVEIVI